MELDNHKQKINLEAIIKETKKNMLLRIILDLKEDIIYNNQIIEDNYKDININDETWDAQEKMNLGKEIRIKQELVNRYTNLLEKIDNEN